MKICPILAALILSLPALAEDKPTAPAPPETAVFAPNDLAKLKEMSGKPVIVEGTVVAQGENKTATIRYLNFSRNYKETISLVFILSGKGGAEFTSEKLGAFVGKKVRVSGTVGIYNEAVQIKIDKLDQIQIQPSPQP